MVRIIKASALDFKKTCPVFPNEELRLFMANHGCFVTTSRGHVIAWGHNTFSRFGHYWLDKSNNSSDLVDSPKITLTNYPLQNHEYFSQVSFGDSHVGYLTNFGYLLVAGKNDQGQLGKNKESHDWISINDEFDLADHDKICHIHFVPDQSLALTQTSKVFVWGSNRLELVDHKKPKITKPTDITTQFQLDSNHKITHIQLVYDATYDAKGSKDTQAIYVVNHNQIFLKEKNKNINITKLFDQPHLEVLKLISEGGTHLLLTKDYCLYYFGVDILDKTKVIKKPIRLDSLIHLTKDDNIEDVKISKSLLCFLTKKGRVFVFGANLYNQMLDQNLQSTDKPFEITKAVQVSEDEKITKIGCNDFNLAVVTSLNRVLIWGSNKYGTIGDRTTNDSPVPYELTLPLF
jgi:alpha-tubulin suppressor-like RCC1 family protein